LKRRYTVIGAARVLGAGTDAVRKWVARGTVEHEGADDTVYVGLDDGHDGGATYRHDNGANGGGGAARVVQGPTRRPRGPGGLPPLAPEPGAREARRRADTIIAQPTRANAALAQQVPELESPAFPDQPREARGSSGRGAEVEGRTYPPDQERRPKRRFRAAPRTPARNARPTTLPQVATPRT
jgi:hypothetical protein